MTPMLTYAELGPQLCVSGPVTRNLVRYLMRTAAVVPSTADIPVVARVTASGMYIAKTYHRFRDLLRSRQKADEALAARQIDLVIAGEPGEEMLMIVANRGRIKFVRCNTREDWVFLTEMTLRRIGPNKWEALGDDAAAAQPDDSEAELAGVGA
jgi:hypothetical protein